MIESNVSLDTLAQNFKAWRGSSRHRAYPKQFWEDINLLSQHHSISDIAKALDINEVFLRQKMKKKAFKFAPVQLKSFYSIVALDFFTDYSDRAMTVRFQADHEQLVNLIASLSKLKS
jgi:hypothetical protein